MADAMKACRECMAEIPVGAKRCMHCGVAQNRETSLLQVVGAVVILGLVVLLFMNLGKIW